VDGKSKNAPLPHRRVSSPNAPGSEPAFLVTSEGVDACKTGAGPAGYYLHIRPKHEMLRKRRMPIGWKPGRFERLGA
jgi:hypothetical protein